MFDRFGRVLCQECMGQMATVKTSEESVIFKCVECNHTAYFTLTIHRKNKMEVRL